MDKSLVWHYWNTTLVMIHATTKHDSNWPCQESSERPVHCECHLVLSFNCTTIFPWNSLGTCHELSEAICYPRVAFKVVLKKFHVLAFLLLRREWWWPQFENFLKFAFLLVEPLVLFGVIFRLCHPVVVGVVVLRGHFDLLI